MFSSSIQKFLLGLQSADVLGLPVDYEVLNPYSNVEVQNIVKQMCQRYYAGTFQRLVMWGINPGRFGAGLTGLSFTDPYGVNQYLGLQSNVVGKNELSAEFFRMVIDEFGGPQHFYSKVYLSAMCPLGFVKNGVNINFYDDKAFSKTIAPFVVNCMAKQHRAGLLPNSCIVLGTGKLKQFFENTVRSPLGYTNVIFLEHPRYIMQYKRKSVQEYVRKYVEAVYQSMPI